MVSPYLGCLVCDYSWAHVFEAGALELCRDEASVTAGSVDVVDWWAGGPLTGTW